jgi:molybdopterin-guanine dinucleotide biosynthesis protein A
MSGLNPATGSVAAIVLAGGASSRFGAPKLAAELDGLPLLDHAIRALAAVASDIVVALPAEPALSEPAVGALPGSVAVRFVRDSAPGGGPLVGLASALAVVVAPRVIVAGGDMPRLQPAVLRAMLDRLEGAAEAVVLADRDTWRPLPVALDAAAGRRAASSALTAGERSLRAMLGGLALVELAAGAWHALDPRAQTLIDVDAPGDLARLRASEEH